MNILLYYITGNIISDVILYLVILVIGTYFMTLHQRNRKAKEKRQNELLEIERNVSTFNNHLLGCTYDFTLKTVKIFYHNIDELIRPDGLRIITADHYDEYGYENRLEWLFQKIGNPENREGATVYKKKEICINFLITLPTNRVDAFLKKKRNGIEYVLHDAKDGNCILQMIYNPK